MFKEMKKNELFLFDGVTLRAPLTSRSDWRGILPPDNFTLGSVFIVFKYKRVGKNIDENFWKDITYLQEGMWSGTVSA